MEPQIDKMSTDKKYMIRLFPGLTPALHQTQCGASVRFYPLLHQHCTGASVCGKKCFDLIPY
jgi:hypothetical protein